jgi:hypothetical protein
MLAALAFRAMRGNLCMYVHGRHRTWAEHKMLST